MTDEEYIKQYRYTDPEGRVWRVRNYARGGSYCIANFDMGFEDCFEWGYLSEKGDIHTPRRDHLITPSLTKAFTALLCYQNSQTPDGELRVRPVAIRWDSLDTWMVATTRDHSMSRYLVDGNIVCALHKSHPSAVAACRALDEYREKQQPEKETAVSEELKVGDRVEVIKDFERRAKSGMQGTVVKLRASSEGWHAVEIDTPFKGHSCNGLLDHNRGYYIPESHLRRIADKPQWRVKVVNFLDIAERGAQIKMDDGSYLPAQDVLTFIDDALANRADVEVAV